MNNYSIVLMNILNREEYWGSHCCITIGIERVLLPTHWSTGLWTCLGWLNMILLVLLLMIHHSRIHNYNPKILASSNLLKKDWSHRTSSQKMMVKRVNTRVMRMEVILILNIGRIFKQLKLAIHHKMTNMNRPVAN